ncbi:MULTISPECIES: rhomboid family intramembrane serine protease [Salinibaculum]|uniref:rhomboid family intramembrane serine protease n=1 Tax=Salinibaculum TaxID=2732368 RepID=UPI0030D16A49
MQLPLDESLLEALSLWALAAGLAYAAYVLVRAGGLRPLTDRLRRRFVLGVPWGTLIVVLGVLGVYFLLQGGGQRGGPVVVAFRSWSFSYPFGLVLAPFSHANEGHITGNLLSTLAFAPVAEYAWSHYATERGSHSFGSWRTNPFARIAAFVVGVFVVGVITSVFIPGALIGFSGVVFAFGGFALVTKPVLAVFALLGERVVRLAWRALESPVVVTEGRQQFVTPFWADIAVQGHAMGLLIGILLGIYVVRRREAWPSLRWVWFAALVFTATKSLYALYWYLASTRYVLFQAAGVAAIVVLATVVAVALARSDRTLVPRIDLQRREAAAGVLLCIVLGLALVSVPYNAISVSSGPEADTGVEVRDFTVTYVEDVPDRYISAVEIPVLRDSLQVNTSGVVVTSEDRDAWEAVVPAGRLAVRGYAIVPLGGVGWRETVVVNRSSWNVLGGGSTYKVFVRKEGDPPKQVFTSEPANVSAVISNRTIQIRPVDPGFEVAVRRNGTLLATAPIPSAGSNASLAGLRFNRTDDTLRALDNGTRIDIARRGQGS